MLQRIGSVTPGDKALRGKMNAHQMIVHCTDQIRMASGEIKCRFVGNALSTSLLKFLFLTIIPTPKGKIETTPELKQGVRGTRLSDFESDKKISPEWLKILIPYLDQMLKFSILFLVTCQKRNGESYAGCILITI